MRCAYLGLNQPISLCRIVSQSSDAVFSPAWAMFGKPFKNVFKVNTWKQIAINLHISRSPSVQRRFIDQQREFTFKFKFKDKFGAKNSLRFFFAPLSERRRIDLSV